MRRAVITWSSTTAAAILIGFAAWVGYENGAWCDDAYQKAVLWSIPTEWRNAESADKINAFAETVSDRCARSYYRSWAHYFKIDGPEFEVKDEAKTARSSAIAKTLQKPEVK